MTAPDVAFAWASRVAGAFPPTQARPIQRPSSKPGIDRRTLVHARHAELVQRAVAIGMTILAQEFGELLAGHSSLGVNHLLLILPTNSERLQS